MNQSTGCPSTTTGVDSNQNSIQKRSISHPTFENPLTVPPITVDLNLQGLRALPQKLSPLQTNRASSGYRASSGSSSPPKTLPSKVHEPSCPPEIAAPHNSTSSQTPPPPFKPTHEYQSQSTSPPDPKNKTWAQRASPIADRSLKPLAPTILSDTGVPQVIVPDEVFERGEALHRYMSFFCKDALLQSNRKRVKLPVGQRYQA